MESVVRKQTVIFVALVIVLSMTMLAFAWVARSMHERQDSVIAAKERLASYEQNKRAYEVEAVQLKEIGAHIGTLENDVVTTATVPQFLSGMETIAQSVPVKFSITAVDAPAADGAGTQFYVDMTASGDIDSIMRFADTVLHQRYQVSFETFSLYADTVPADPKVPTPPIKDWQLLARIKVVSF